MIPGESRFAHLRLFSALKQQMLQVKEKMAAPGGGGLLRLTSPLNLP